MILRYLEFVRSAPELLVRQKDLRVVTSDHNL